MTWAGFELTTLVVIGTDCIGRYDYDHDAPYINLENNVTNHKSCSYVLIRHSQLK